MNTITHTTKITIGIIIVLLLGLGIYVYSRSGKDAMMQKGDMSIDISSSTVSGQAAQKIADKNGSKGSVVSPKKTSTYTTVKKNPLAGTSWIWQNTVFTNKTPSISPSAQQFVITFGTDDALTTTTDCNSAAGRFAVNGDKVAITSVASTLMACEGPTLESQYVTELTQVGNFIIVGPNELHFNLLKNAGTMTFSKR
jgi:heat shock protein HslJ